MCCCSVWPLAWLSLSFTQLRDHKYGTIQPISEGHNSNSKKRRKQKSGPYVLYCIRLYTVAGLAHRWWFYCPFLPTLFTQNNKYYWFLWCHCVQKCSYTHNILSLQTFITPIPIHTCEMRPFSGIMWRTSHIYNIQMMCVPDKCRYHNNSHRWFIFIFLHRLVCASKNGT